MLSKSAKTTLFADFAIVYRLKKNPAASCRYPKQDFSSA
jgi:hypothetical protein